MKDYMEKIKTLRQQQGVSQEELAERSGLSLRTIQRIENGETEPRGDSLKRIAAALGVTPNEIMDWAVQENNHFLSALNLSALTFLFFPLLGIIVPYILWSSKRDTVKGAERTGKAIVNFQITWILSVYPLFLLFRPIGPGLVGFGLTAVLLSLVYNLTLILVNQWRIGKGKPVRYFPKINFLR
jgi:transcriptional regulator with XRE-family HTH domain